MLHTRRFAFAFVLWTVCLALSIAAWPQNSHVTRLGGDTLRFEETGNVPSSGNAV